jgi:hypothetical protein
LAHFLGLDGGAWYNFFSGLFGVLVITGGLVGNAWVNARRHNCHQPRCWRVGRLPVEGTPFVVCHRHHPAPPGAETIRQRHHLYVGDKPGRG